MSGSQYCSSQTSLCPVEIASPGSYPRAYLLHDRLGVAHYSYRMTLEINPILGEYYGVQGTTWLNPPILNKPSATKFVNGKELLLFADGGKLSMVAWRTPLAPRTGFRTRSPRTSRTASWSRSPPR